mmetsp:Transcript_20383/g.30036  ORF Transcript_20383/g.30036 Transcript_20383/m.30036 type:complete len:584 (+) Transcript_20383:58-1809(+)
MQVIKKRAAVIQSIVAFSFLNRSSLAFVPTAFHFHTTTTLTSQIKLHDSFPKVHSKTSLNMNTDNDDADKKTQFNLVHSNDVEAVRNAPKLDGKRPTKMTTSTFLLTVMVGVPLWLTVAMPLTVVYQAGKKVFSVSSPEDSDAVAETLVHQETFPETHELKPLKDRTYDVVLLGGTGFTGRLAAMYLAENYNKNIRWAIAGRSKDKLDKLLKELKGITGDSAKHDIDVILVDTSKPSTLHALANDSRCVITTAGPFWKYGSNVVEFCARYGTNYVDITGETGWNKEMIMKWDVKAQETGAKIVSLCGNDSIPWDMTYFKLAQMLRDDCKDEIAEVRCYDEMKGGFSGGTIDTALSFLENKYIQPRFDFDPYYKKVDGSKSRNKAKDISSQFISKRNKSDGEEKWANPFVMSSVNAEVVKRSHALNDSLDGQALTYAESVVQVGFKEAFVTWFAPIFGVTALLNPVTGFPMKKLLPKPGEGPREKDMKYGYLLVSGVGEGVKGSKVESELYFPSDPGYRDTARMISEAGLCLALDSEKLPVQGGGFFSPSVAMGDALLQRLCSTGCKFASRVVATQDGKLHSKL